MTTIGSLQRLSATSLSKLILAEQASTAAAAAGTENSRSTLVIIDVRDDDYIGGHIKGSQNVPSHKLDAMLPTLVRQLQDKETVVFHCALSQQRGPSAALRYIRERDRLMPKEVETKQGEEEEERKKPVDQKVFVLDRGFVGWQEAFGLDERLTEGYSKELWRDGYWM
ncbi:Rhodanese-like domain-containing protein [Neurospora intermedia]|uniref:Rhodanese-like domain-containing protein n=1 Tax=Neurospora intermedia TaxID=5142 RepID=A0ABR3DIE7_NEUIN